MNNIFITWIGLTTGNYIYQALGEHNWLVATERSFFQGGAFIALILIMIIWKLKITKEG